MMKKILLLLLGFSLITYCSIFNISALDTTLNYEQKYNAPQLMEDGY